MINITHRVTGKVLHRVAGPTLAKVNLAGAQLCGADLHYAVLQRTELRRADLHLASLLEADLTGAHLEETDFQEADLRGADLTSANLEGADLREANLSGASLRGARMRGARLYGTVLRDTIYNQSTQWPPGFRPEVAGATEEGPGPTPGAHLVVGGQNPGTNGAIEPPVPSQTRGHSEEPDWENEGGSVPPCQDETMAWLPSQYLHLLRADT